MSIARYIQCAVFALAMGVSALAHANVSEPAFLTANLTPTYRAPVATVANLADKDVVFLAGGFDQNLGEGMKCTVERSNTIIAEIILIKVNPTVSAGLILQLAPEVSIQRGDVARVKTFSRASNS